MLLCALLPLFVLGFVIWLRSGLEQTERLSRRGLETARLDGRERVAGRTCK